MEDRSINTVQKLTNQDFVHRVQDLVGDSYVFLQNYQNVRTKIAYYHVDCGQVHYISPESLKGTRNRAGRRCPTCSKIKRNMKITKSQEEWNKEVHELTGNEYIFLEPYKGNHTPIKYKHMVCGHIGKTSPANFLSGHGCSYCSPTRDITDKEFKQRVNQLVGDEYQVLDSYSTNRQPIRMKHNKCGTIWWVLPVNFFNGSRCPTCNESKGERIVEAVLRSFSLSYIHGYVLSNGLHLDFYLANLHLGIEYDGIQHFEARNYFGGQKAFVDQKLRDKREDAYCKAHNIKLVRIPYTIKTFNKVKKLLSTYINL